MRLSVRSVQRFVEAMATADEPKIVLTVNHASAPAVRPHHENTRVDVWAS